MPNTAYAVSESYLGLGKETTYGTIQAPTIWLPVMEPDLTPMLDYYPVKVLEGSPVEDYGLVPGLYHTEYACKGPVFLDTFPNLLRAALGSSDTVTGTTAPYTHTIGLLANAGSGNQSPSYTLSDWDGSTMRQMPAARLETLTITSNAAGLLEYSTKFIANKFTGTTATSASFSTQQASPAWDLVASVGGSAITYIEDLEITFGRGTKPIQALTGDQNPFINFQGPLMPSFKMTVVEQSGSPQLSAFIANTVQVLDFTWTEPVSLYTLNIHATTAKFKTAKVVRSKEWVEIELEGEMLPNSTDVVAGGLSPVKTATTNGQSAQY